MMRTNTGTNNRDSRSFSVEFSKKCGELKTQESELKTATNLFHNDTARFGSFIPKGSGLLISKNFALNALNESIETLLKHAPKSPKDLSVELLGFLKQLAENVQPIEKKDNSGSIKKFIAKHQDKTSASLQNYLKQAVEDSSLIIIKFVENIQNISQHRSAFFCFGRTNSHEKLISLIKEKINHITSKNKSHTEVITESIKAKREAYSKNVWNVLQDCQSSFKSKITQYSSIEELNKQFKNDFRKAIKEINHSLKKEELSELTNNVVYGADKPNWGNSVVKKEDILNLNEKIGNKDPFKDLYTKLGEVYRNCNDKGQQYNDNIIKIQNQMISLIANKDNRKKLLDKLTEPDLQTLYNVITDQVVKAKLDDKLKGFFEIGYLYLSQKNLQRGKSKSM